MKEKLYNLDNEIQKIKLVVKELEEGREYSKNQLTFNEGLAYGVLVSVLLNYIVTFLYEETKIYSKYIFFLFLFLFIVFCIYMARHAIRHQKHIDMTSKTIEGINEYINRLEELK